MVHASEVERLEREKTRLEQTIIEQSVELSLLKKTGMGKDALLYWAVHPS